MSDGFECIPCITGCSVCQMDGTCLACLTGYSLISSNLLSTTTCVQNTTCNGYQYSNGSGSCVNCSLYGGCNTCSAKYNCSSCLPNGGLARFLFEANCVYTCETGYFVDLRSMQCRPCSSTCVQCLGYGQCTLCVNDYYLLVNPIQLVSGQVIGTCVPTCPMGYYNYYPINSNKNISSCQFCSSNCLSCFGSD